RARRRRRRTRRDRDRRRRIGRQSAVTLWPRSLFGRLVLLLVVVVALAALTTAAVFNRDRAALIAKQFGDTKIVQLKALRAALEGADGPQRRETLFRLGREYGVRIIPESERPTIGAPVMGPAMQDLERHLQDALGNSTSIRIAPRLQQLFVRVDAAGDGYWVGFPLPPRPLRDLSAAVERVGRGETPPPLPESGPSEFAAVNHGFNAMIGNLRQIERDRAVLLAGVSHDLRTPLARLRLGIEMSARDEATR